MVLYIRENARNAAATNDDLAGVGVMFEPYAFQDVMRNFAFYVEVENADADVKPFGTYETYSAEIYYQDAVSSGQAVVTDPYEYNGTRMVSYATPIIHNGELQGVTMADINVSNFDKANATSEELSGQAQLMKNLAVQFKLRGAETATGQAGQTGPNI